MQTTLTLTHLRLLLRAPSRWRQGLSVLLCIVVLSSSSFAQGSKADADELKLVVALFRHGVRSPEADFDQEEADKHSKNKWPDLPAWNVMGKDCENAGKTAEGWGYLTKHGQQIATGLGTYYGNYYKQGPWSGGFQKVYFWADAENQRTRETAAALANGFRAAGIPDVKVDSLTPCTRDLLFHPFEAECGTPDPRKFADIASYIASNWKTTWTKKYKAQFDQLFRTLGCSADDCATCDISHCFTDADTVTSWKLGAPRTSPIKWTGRFSYASSASEAFLLEYANNMQVGWGNVDAGGLRKMLFLHEFFFDQTERQPYISAGWRSCRPSGPAWTGVGSAGLATRSRGSRPWASGRPSACAPGRIPTARLATCSSSAPRGSAWPRAVRRRSPPGRCLCPSLPGTPSRARENPVVDHVRAMLRLGGIPAAQVDAQAAAAVGLQRALESGRPPPADGASGSEPQRLDPRRARAPGAQLSLEPVPASARRRPPRRARRGRQRPGGARGPGVRSGAGARLEGLPEDAAGRGHGRRARAADPHGPGVSPVPGCLRAGSGRFAPAGSTAWRPRPTPSPSPLAEPSRGAT